MRRPTKVSHYWMFVVRGPGGERAFFMRDGDADAFEWWERETYMLGHTLDHDLEKLAEARTAGQEARITISLEIWTRERIEKHQAEVKALLSGQED